MTKRTASMTSSCFDSGLIYNGLPIFFGKLKTVANCNKTLNTIFFRLKCQRKNRFGYFNVTCTLKDYVMG